MRPIPASDTHEMIHIDSAYVEPRTEPMLACYHTFKMYLPYLCDHGWCFHDRPAFMPLEISI